VRGVLRSPIGEHGGCEYRLPLPPHPIAAEQARILVRLALAAWSMDGAVDDAPIVVGDLDTTPDAGPDAARLYDQGWSIRQVAAKFDCSYGTMRRILRKNGNLRSRDRTYREDNP